MMNTKLNQVKYFRQGKDEMEVDRVILKNLVQLNQLDRQLYDLAGEKEERPKKLAKERRALDKLNKERLEIEEKIKEKNLLVHQEELELKDFTDKIKKQEGRLNEAKSNKEYNAIRSEIANMKADSELIEDRVLDRMEDVEKLKNELAEIDKQVKKEEEKFKAKEERVGMALKHLDEQMSTITEERSSAANVIPEEIFSYYERILERTNGDAVAEVKESVCRGCYCSCTPQDENLLLIQKQLVICKNCSRILYLSQNGDS